MLKTLTKSEIKKKINRRPLENPRMIADIEAFLIKQRGYVFKMPEPGSSIIMLFSGGLDSTPLAAMLMEEFKLKIYPVFTLRGHSYQRAELKALAFWTKYFQERYPGQFYEPKKITTNFPPYEIRWAYEKVENLKVKKGSPQIWGDYFYSNLLCTHAAQYSYFLKITKNISIKNIFCAFMPIDGEGKIDMTLTSLRATMLGICSVTNDFSWQISSIPLEKELGFFFDKDYFISWADRHGIPLEKTRSSCQEILTPHCGNCLFCNLRRKAFKKAGVKDKTDYLSDRIQKSVFHKLFYKAIRKLLRTYRKITVPR